MITYIYSYIDIWHTLLVCLSICLYVSKKLDNLNRRWAGSSALKAYLYMISCNYVNLFLSFKKKLLIHFKNNFKT